MEKFLIIFVVCALVSSLLVYLFFYWKKYRTRKEVERQKKEVERQKAKAEAEAQNREKKELIEACKNADIGKMIELLEKGLDPNTRVQVWVRELRSYPLEICCRSHYEVRSLLDISCSPAVTKLLKAYGAKNIEEIRNKKSAIKKDYDDTREDEIRRQDAILEAEKKAKEEADMQKVEAFLASKKA